MEQDPSFKQLIPYCIFRFEDQIFYYRRSKGTGEGRLHGKRSIGVGGHISSEDQAAASPYLQAMQREIAEEVFLESGYRQSCVGLLNDDESEVGKVHLGVVHIFDLDEPKVLPRETTMIEILPKISIRSRPGRSFVCDMCSRTGDQTRNRPNQD